MMRDKILRESALVIGFSCVSAAAFMIAVPLGLAVVGVPLMVLAFGGAKKDDKHDAR